MNYVLGPLLFIVLSWSIYRRIQQQRDLQYSWTLIKASFHGPGQWKIWTILLLSLVNWGIEARKWQLLTAPVQRISLFKAFKSVLSGLALSLFVPNRVGEYLGRLLHMEEGNRLRSIALTVVGGISQLIVTMVGGMGGLIYLRYRILHETQQLQGLSVFWLDGLMYALGAAIVVFLLCYYKLSLITLLLEKIPLVAKYRFFIQTLETFHWKALTRILLLSTTRFLVFVVQYLLLFQVFQVNLSWISGGWMVCVLFLVLAIVPTVPIAELGVRGEASIQLFGLLSSNTVGIIATAAGIWCINLIIPSIAGTLFILSVQLFKKQRSV